jgi:hypothetical protein
MAIARAKGKLRGKQPKLTTRQQRELVRMQDTGEYSIAELGELFTVSRAPSTASSNATASPTRQPVSRPRPDHPTKINGIVLRLTSCPTSGF